FAAEFGLPVATVANVQKALEIAYGAGNVQVVGGAETSPGVLAPFHVTTDGEDADERVPAIQVGNILKGDSTSAKVVTEGRSDGEIYLTIENVGNAPASGATEPIQIADKLPPGIRAV